MIEVGRIERDLGAHADYAVEDELDWEHLPHVHASTFSTATLIHADEDGWEADVVLTSGDPMRMRVTMHEDRMGWINSTFTDGVENGRAVSRLEATGPESCRITISFFVPEAPAGDAAAAGAFYCDLFNRLLDEDEPKMILRAKAVRDGPAARRERRISKLADGSTIQVPRVCPHQGLPLDCEPNAQDVMTCPWHGYRFDARTGQCLSGQIRGWREA